MDYKITVPLETHYDKPNRNGIIYSKESIEEMLNSDHFKELEKNKCLFIIRNNLDKNGFADLSNVIGKVDSLDIENGIANISVNKEVYSLYKNGCDMSLGMNYTGKLNNNKKVTDMKFLSYSLIDKNTGNLIIL